MFQPQKLKKFPCSHLQRIKTAVRCFPHLFSDSFLKKLLFEKTPLNELFDKTLLIKIRKMTVSFHYGELLLLHGETRKGRRTRY